MNAPQLYRADRPTRRTRIRRRRLLWVAGACAVLVLLASLLGGGLPSLSRDAERSVASTVVPPPVDERGAALAALTRPPELPDAVLQRDTALRSGEFEATLAYGDGIRAVTRVQFDRGDQVRAARAYVVSRYEGKWSVQSFERITVGSRAWERQGSGRWIAVESPADVAAQVSPFLPAPASVTTPVSRTASTFDLLYWFDQGLNADMTLEVESATGTPRYLRQQGRDGALLTVVYTAWNTPIVVTAPVGG